MRVLGSGWTLLHPFDRTFRTDTSGAVPPELLPSSSLDSARLNGYGAVQPSILRAALNAVQPLDRYTFVDLGCGKGRALLIASEFPFRGIVGVELSAALGRIARRNARSVCRRFAKRAPMRVELADAGSFPFPAGDLLVFLYNPFGEGVVAQVVARLESLRSESDRTIVVIYCNPVHGHCFDASPTFDRHLAAQMPYAPDELGFGPDTSDGMVIWQAGLIKAQLNRTGLFDQPSANPNASIRVSIPGLRAEIAD